MDGDSLKWKNLSIKSPFIIFIMIIIIIAAPILLFPEQMEYNYLHLSPMQYRVLNKAHYRVH